MTSLVEYIFKLKRALFSGAWHDRRESDETLSNPLAMSDVISRDVLQARITALLSRQFQDAKNKQQNTSHWGNIGWQVETAAQQCKSIISMQDDEELLGYFERVLPNMANLAARYRVDKMDEEGYGLGTVREVENYLIQQAKIYENTLAVSEEG